MWGSGWRSPSMWWRSPRFINAAASWCSTVMLHSESVLQIDPEDRVKLLFHSHTNTVLSIPSFPPASPLDGKEDLKVVLVSDSSEGHSTFVFISSKIKDKIKKRPDMWPLSIWLIYWTLFTPPNPCGSVASQQYHLCEAHQVHLHGQALQFVSWLSVFMHMKWYTAYCTGILCTTCGHSAKNSFYPVDKQSVILDLANSCHLLWEAVSISWRLLHFPNHFTQLVLRAF